MELHTRDGRYLSNSVNRYIPKETCWINYARCHDDIGWGIDDNIIKGLGFDPYQHKQFLINFYNGNILMIALQEEDCMNLIQKIWMPEIQEHLQV